jgi:hypothetical protein
MSGHVWPRGGRPTSSAAFGARIADARGTAFAHTMAVCHSLAHAREHQNGTARSLRQRTDISYGVRLCLRICHPAGRLTGNCHQIHVHQSSSKFWRHGLYPFRVTASPRKPRARWLTEVFIQLDVSGLLDDWIPIGETTEVPAHQVGAIGQPLVDMAAGLRPSGHPPGRLYAVDSCTGQRAQEPTGYERGQRMGGRRRR